jgi:hypothetical protein
MFLHESYPRAVIPQDRWRGARGRHRRPGAIRSKQDIDAVPHGDARDSGRGRGVGVLDREINSHLGRPQSQGAGARPTVASERARQGP